MLQIFNFPCGIRSFKSPIVWSECLVWLYHFCLDTPEGVAQELVSAGLINGVDMILGKSINVKLRPSHLLTSIFFCLIPVLELRFWDTSICTFISCIVAANLEKALENPAAYRHPAFMVFQLVGKCFHFVIVNTSRLRRTKTLLIIDTIGYWHHLPKQSGVIFNVHAHIPEMKPFYYVQYIQKLPAIDRDFLQLLSVVALWENDVTRAI